MLQAPDKVVSVGAGTAAKLLCAFCFVCLCHATAGYARTVYVRIAGDDGNDGSSPSMALRTIKHAAVLATPDDRVVVGPGTYVEGAIAPTAFARVSFIADRRGREVGEPPGDVVLDASGFSAGFTLSHNLAITIDGFVIYGAGIGIYVKSASDQAVLSNNIVSNNNSNAVYIQDSRNATVFNNLVYNNGGSGVLMTGNVTGSSGARVINNTVYGNGNRGIFFSGTTVGSPGGLVINNAVQANQVAGIQVNETSRDGYRSAGNVTANRFASGTPIDPTDISADPLFVDPDGPDNMLGGPNYADDDFHLKNQRAGQAVTSPAVDAGSVSARGLHLNHSSTRTDGRSDLVWVDAGYHYRNFRVGGPPMVVLRRTQPIYVSVGHGSDENDGSSRTSALRTLGQALQFARSGNEIVLVGGTYSEGELSPTSSGLPGRPLGIRGVNGATIDASGFQRGLLLSGRHDVTINGVSITGASESGIEIRNGSSRIAVQSCRLRDNARRGLYVSGSSDISVRASTIENNRSRGIQVENGQVDISESRFATNGDSNLWALNGSTLTLSSSQVVGSPGSGVLADHSQVTLQDSTIAANTGGGVHVSGASTTTLDRVTIQNNGGEGIQGVSSVVSVTGGAVEGNARLGIEAFVDPINGGSSQLSLSGTRVCNNHGLGISPQDTSVTLTDATLCANTAEGLRQSGGTLTMRRTTVTGNQGRGILANGASDVSLEDNAVDNNGDNGLQLMAVPAASVIGGTISSNALNGVSATSGSIVSLVGVELSENQQSGILVDQSQIMLDDSTVNGSKGEGIRQSGGTLTVRNTLVTGNLGRGILANAASDVSLEDTAVDSNGDNGVQLMAVPAASVTRGTISSNALNGLTATSSSMVTVSGAQLAENQQSGILVDQSQIVLQDSTVRGNNAGGVRCLKGSTGRLTGVTLMGNADTGVQGLSSVLTVTGGVVEGSTRVGIESAVDAASPGTTMLTVSQTQVCHNPLGIRAQDSAVSLTDITLCNNDQEGLRQNGGSAEIHGATVIDNGSKGLSVTGASRLVVADATVARNADNGVQVSTSTAPMISGSVFCSNTGDGLTILDSASALVSNNLIYANGSTGVLISGALSGSPNAQVMNNTVYSNANRGIFIGGGNDTAQSPGATVLRNIIQGNGTAGLQVNQLSVPGYTGDYNLNTDPYGTVSPGAHDVLSFAWFVNPAGADGVLGGAGAADDDFRLSQRAAGQRMTSPAVDAGGISAVAAGMQIVTTRSDGVSDSGIVDLGFHYKH